MIEYVYRNARGVLFYQSNQSNKETDFGGRARGPGRFDRLIDSIGLDSMDGFDSISSTLFTIN